MGGGAFGNVKHGHAECSGERASVLLAEVMNDKLGVELEPDVLRAFIQGNFNRVSTLAHAIHDDIGGADLHVSNLAKDLMQHGAADPLGR